MKQELKNKIWKDESGQDVPVVYISQTDRLKERHAFTILKQAKQLNAKLVDYKKEVAKLCLEVYTQAMKDFKVKEDGKGNYIWFNFNRSIKVEVSINERIDFDDLTIKACKAKLDEFLDINIDSKQGFVKELITDAFSTSRGKLDSKKVMGLLKYRTKITDELFQESLNLLEQSICRPDSKTYFRVFERNEDGSYSSIDLNFSNL